MTLRARFALFACGVTLVAAAPLDAQDSSAATLRGRVIDARTLAPVAAATVTVTSGRDTVARTAADLEGFYAAPLRTLATRSPMRPTTRLVAHYRRIGYQADSLALDSAPALPVDVAMTPLRTVVALAPAVITARATPSAMEARVRRSGGTFIGPAEIARRGPSRTSDLLRGVRGLLLNDENGVVRIASARLVQLRVGAGPAVRAPTVGSDSTRDPLEGVVPPVGGRPCLLRIGVDGRLMPEEFTVDEVPASDVAGIEVYRGAATLPIELSSGRGDAKCGMLMIWTRLGGNGAP